jgi:hypothetical protein
MNEPYGDFESELDRLVDGELTDEGRRELLAVLEARPDGWRRCALAFLEAQAWRSEMGAWVAGGRGGQRAAATVAPSPERVRAVPSGWSVYGILAAAAAVLAAFGLGRFLDQPPQERLGPPQVAMQSPSEPPAIAEPAPPRGGDFVTLVVNDHHGKPQRVEIPLVEGQRLGNQFAQEPAWSEAPELARRLDRQGLGVEVRRRYAPLFFEQEDRLIPMVVPVDDAVVRPVSRPLY